MQPLLSIARAEDEMKEKEEELKKAQEQAKADEEKRKLTRLCDLPCWFGARSDHTKKP